MRRLAAAALCLQAAWSCCAAGIGEGMNSNCNTSSLQVCRGDNGSLSLPLEVTKMKMVDKWNPKTKKWEEVVLTHLESSNHFKATSISLANQVFTVWNAEKTDQGLYRIKQFIDDKCLVVVNITVLDCPLPVTPSSTVTASSDVSSTVISKVAETAHASPPGRNHTAICIAVLIAVILMGIILVVVVRREVKKESTRRHNESRSVADPEPCVNGLLSHQQCMLTEV